MEVVDKIMNYILNWLPIIGVSFFTGVVYGVFIANRLYFDVKKKVLNDIYWIGDEDGDNPEIEYEEL